VVPSPYLVFTVQKRFRTTLVQGKKEVLGGMGIYALICAAPNEIKISYRGFLLWLEYVDWAAEQR